jgi:hypothetical protein
MPSISIRKEIVPLGAVVIHSDSCKPVGYTNETSLFSKFVKGTPTAGTAPGGTEGSSTHTHCAAGDHTHGTTSLSHTHTKTSDTMNNGGVGNALSVTLLSHYLHDHLVTSSATAPTATVTTDSNHTHDAQNNLPVNKTQFFLNHSETSVNLRRKALGQSSIFMWGQSLANLPSRYAKEDNFDSQHIQGVANACSTPNVSGGVNTHAHDVHAPHDHNVTIPTHSHGVGSVADDSTTDRCYSNYSPAQQGANRFHIHGAGTANFDNNSKSADSATSTSPSHDCLNQEPAYKTIYFVSQQSIGLRDGGIPPGGIVLWTDAVGCNLPYCWQVGDGTNGTTNMLSKYPKGEAGCSPGTTGGSDTHTHASGGGSHTHASVNLSHTHCTSGEIQNSTINAPTNTGSDPVPTSGHDHNLTGASSSNDPGASLTSTSDAHTHGSKNNQPPTVLVAMIERLTP